MAGDRSLHETYAVDRDYELWVIYFGDDEGVAERYARTCDRLISAERDTNGRWRAG